MSAISFRLRPFSAQLQYGIFVRTCTSVYLLHARLLPALYFLGNPSTSGPIPSMRIPRCQSRSSVLARQQAVPVKQHGNLTAKIGLLNEVVWAGPCHAIALVPDVSRTSRSFDRHATLGDVL
jgi:hypothetical protein